MFQRSLTEKILPWLGTNKIINIKGARRVGKTVLLHHLEQTLKDRGESTLYISVEQRRHLPIFGDPKKFVHFLREQYPAAGGKKLYLFLDDLQYIKDPIHFLKTVDEMTAERCQLIVAASTTFPVTKEQESFDNKRKKFFLHHLSFREYISFRSGQPYDKKFSVFDKEELEDFYAEKKEEIEAHLGDFLCWGGYPEIAVEPDEEKKFDMLGDIIHRHIEKDIASSLRVENVDAYIQLMAVLSSEVGNLLNHQDISTRLDIHKKTLSKYLDIIRNTFTFSFVSPYFTNTKKELAKMCKVYVEDIGIMSYFLHQSPRDRLAFFANMPRIKNFIFSELRKTEHNNKLFFYRTIAKAEIDFVICGEEDIIPVKVKFGRDKQKVPVVMKNFMSAYKPLVKKAIVITRDELRYEDNCVFLPISLLPFV